LENVLAIYKFLSGGEEEEIESDRKKFSRFGFVGAKLPIPIDEWVSFDSSNGPDIKNNGSNSCRWKNISEPDNGGPLDHMNTLAANLPW
ncbi:hypothetical protein KI387_010511, partial [Taxus chinensis]